MVFIPFPSSDLCNYEIISLQHNSWFCCLIWMGTYVSGSSSQGTAVWGSLCYFFLKNTIFKIVLKYSWFTMLCSLLLFLPAFSGAPVLCESRLWLWDAAPPAPTVTVSPCLVSVYLCLKSPQARVCNIVHLMGENTRCKSDKWPILCGWQGENRWSSWHLETNHFGFA